MVTRPPPVFDGTVVINLSKDNSNTTVDTTHTQDIPTISSKKNISNIINELDVVNTTNSNPPLADSLDAVFNLLGMNDNEQTVSEDTTNQVIVTEINQNESHLIIDNPIVNQVNHQNLILEASAEKSIPVIEFTETEKKVMKQIDEIIPTGEHFMQWLKEAILTQKLIINEPQALVHTVDDTIFIITPGIFMRYVMEFPQTQVIAKTEKIPAWRYMQKAFEKLKYHQRSADGYSIWTCAVEGPKSTKKVYGYLFDKPTVIIPDIVYNNPYLKIYK